jgi:hypothetical protein
MEGRQDKGSGYEFNGTRKSPEQLPLVVPPHRMHVSFGTNFHLSLLGVSRIARTRRRTGDESGNV